MVAVSINLCMPLVCVKCKRVYVSAIRPPGLTNHQPQNYLCHKCR